MREIFADAGYWIAVLDRNDELHERARSVTGRLVLRRPGAVTYAVRVGHPATSRMGMRSR